ncbi:TonB-dependent receptor plug domain-containing protein [Methylomonas methanica]|uniref:TonB-dependent receptor n=1 Tax=Methylomonas methanica (strain DSM 25384 / MC09) TaxID=857087 RepID=F9ZZC0_METMM|nr:TonB-dependent receptor [Methylomonas methanica]AEG02313.1 TonB-dependent receptor [Methylomonas methanica MC09]
MRYRLQLQLMPSLLLSLMGSVAHAQHDMDDLMELSPAQLADISVSIASGTLKSLSHSAAVTSVITAEQIKAMGATELHEILETVPGMHVTIQPVTNDYNYSMRGIRNDANAEVLLMMNGTRFSVPYQGTHMAGMIIPVQNIQRIEVIRGPGSALYGADAFAGVINIVTKKAADLDGVTLGARGGNADTKSSWGQYGGQWQGWDIAASLQYSHNGVDPDRVIQADALTGTGFSSAPGPMQTQNERWNGHLNLQRKHWDLSFWAFNEADAGFRAGTAGALDNKGRLNGSNYLADVRYSTEDDLPNWELQPHASFLHTDVNANIYNTPPGSVLPIDANGNATNQAALTKGLVTFPEGMRFNTGIKNTVANFELTSIYKGFTDHLIRVVSGFRYEELNTREARNSGAGILDVPVLPSTAGGLQNLTGTPFTFLGDHHRDIWSMALQDEWQVAEDWHLTTGLRYDHYSDFGSTWNPRAALIWDINPRLTGKVLYGQAYRAPSFLEQYQQNSALFTGNPSLKPETIETTELAFDYRPTNNLRTTLNLFHYEIRDLIGVELVAPITAANTSGQQAYGSEFEWDWKFLPEWTLRGNYAWQYARNQNDSSRVSNVPEHHVYSALAWNFLPRWQIQTQINWVGHRVSSPGDSRTLPDYETIDLTLNAKRLFGHLDLTASARNLFDSHGREAAVISYPNNLPIPGQSFYFEASIHF